MVAAFDDVLARIFGQLRPGFLIAFAVQHAIGIADDRERRSPEAREVSCRVRRQKHHAFELLGVRGKVFGRCDAAHRMAGQQPAIDVGKLLGDALGSRCVQQGQVEEGFHQHAENALVGETAEKRGICLRLHFRAGIEHHARSRRCGNKRDLAVCELPDLDAVIYSAFA